MSSKGQIETNKLKQNLEEQLERLVQQLADLEECKDDLEPSEYEESKSDTMEQLEELNIKLKKHLAGDMTLVDQLSSMQLATQAAISKAFQTPAVIRMFARREPLQLRDRLQVVDREVKLGKLSSNAGNREKAEILSALRQLGEKLSPADLLFLTDHTDSQMSMGKNLRFEQVTEESNDKEPITIYENYQLDFSGDGDIHKFVNEDGKTFPRIQAACSVGRTFIRTNEGQELDEVD